MPGQFRTVLVFVSLILFSNISLAVDANAYAGAHGPWIGPGDVWARHDLQRQVDHGCLDAPITTWPLSTADARASCNDALRSPQAGVTRSSTTASPAVPHEPDADAIGAGVRLAANSDPNIFRFFGTQPRERAEAGAWLQYIHRDESAEPVFAARLEATAVDPFGDDTQHWRADGSWLAAFPGNWVIGAGVIDRWWGPGWFSSLALSTNARPVPSVWLARDQARAFETPWLNWIGPWHLTFFAGQMESDRAVPHAKLLGARVTFRPTERLEVGLTRVAQWGGEGRPESLDSFWNLVIGRDNGETSGLADGEDPSNQRGGMDFRYGMPITGGNTLGFYGQIIGDDEAGVLPSKFSGLVGIDMATSIGRGSQRWVLEATNTVAGGWFDDPRHLVTYEHGTYRTGYRYHGRALASTFERDAQVVTVGAWQFLPNRHMLWANFSVIDLNRADTLRASAPGDGTPVLAMPERHKGQALSAGWSFPLRHSRVTVSGQWFDEPLVTVAGELPRTTWSASWEIPF